MTGFEKEGRKIYSPLFFYLKRTRIGSLGTNEQVMNI